MLAGGTVFIIYKIITTILLCNMFIMVLIAVFKEVRANTMKQTNDYEVMDHLHKKVPGLTVHPRVASFLLESRRFWSLEVAKQVVSKRKQ